AKALSSGYLSLGYLENSGLKPPPSEFSFSQLADELDIPFSTLEKLYIACGLGHPSPEELVRAQDVPIIRAVPILFGARVSEGEALRAVRIWEEGARRLGRGEGAAPRWAGLSGPGGGGRMAGGGEVVPGAWGPAEAWRGAAGGVGRAAAGGRLALGRWGERRARRGAAGADASLWR